MKLKNIISTILICLFCSSCFTNNTNVVEKNTRSWINHTEKVLEITDKEQYKDFDFSCIDNINNESILKKSIYFQDNWNKFKLFLFDTNKCGDIIRDQEYEAFNIPLNALSAFYLNNEIFYLTIEEENFDFIIKKGTFYRSWIKIYYLDFKRFNFDENWNYIDKNNLNKMDN